MKIMADDITEFLQICNLQLIKSKNILAEYDKFDTEFKRVRTAEYNLKSWRAKTFGPTCRDFIYSDDYQKFISVPRARIISSQKQLKQIISKLLPLVAETKLTFLLDDAEISALTTLMVLDEDTEKTKIKNIFKQHLNFIL